MAEFGTPLARRGFKIFVIFFLGWTSLPRGLIGLLTKMANFFFGFWPFLKFPSWADFEKLDLVFFQIFVTENRKNYHRQYFSLDACSGPMWGLYLFQG